MEPIEVDILDKGKVVLIDVFGDDSRIATVARTSYKKGTKRVNTDRGLVRYLLRHKHTSPLEMAEVMFYLKVPIFVARQLVRHRTANLNELSGRYSEMPDDAYLPDVEQLGPQSSENNQGRAEVTNVLSAQKARQNIRFAITDAYDSYDRLLNVSNVSREISRIVLPLAAYTELYWKCDLHNFLHFCKLRMDSHAQYEIRVMAQAMYDLVKPFFPVVTEAWEDYILYAQTVSRLDQKLLALVLQGETPTLEVATSLGLSSREYKEFMSWLEGLRETEQVNHVVVETSLSK